jgi:hypothetical protein
MIIKRQSTYNLLLESLKDAKLYIEKQVPPNEKDIAQEKLVILNDLITNDRKGKGKDFFVPLLKMMVLDDLNKDQISNIMEQAIDKLDFNDIPDNMKLGATQHPQFIRNLFNKAIEIRKAVKDAGKKSGILDNSLVIYKGKPIPEIITDFLSPVRQSALVNRLISAIPQSTAFLNSEKGSAYKQRASIREEVLEVIALSPAYIRILAGALSQLKDFKFGVKKIGMDLEQRSANYYGMTVRKDWKTIRNFLLSLIAKYTYTKEEREEVVQTTGGAKVSLVYSDDRFSVFGVRHHSVFLPYDSDKKDKSQGICFNAAWCVAHRDQFISYGKDAIQLVIYDFGLLLPDGSTNFLDPMFQIAFHIDKNYKFTNSSSAVQSQDEGNIPANINKTTEENARLWARARAAFGGKFDTDLGLDAFKKMGLPTEEIKKGVDHEFLMRGATDLFLYSDDKDEKKRISDALGALIRLPQKIEVFPSYDKILNKITFANLIEFSDIAKSLINKTTNKQEIKDSTIKIIKANGGLCISIQMELLDKLNLEFTKENYEEILNVSKTSSDLFSKTERKGFGARSMKIQKAGERMSPNSDGFKNLIAYLEEKLGIREKKKDNPLDIIESLVKMGQNEKDKLMKFFSLIFSKSFNKGEFTLDDLEEFAKTKLKVIMSPVTPKLFIDAMENYPEGVGIIITYHIDALDSLNVVLDPDKYNEIQQEMTENIKMIRDDLSQGLAEFELSYDVISKNYHLTAEKLRAKMT